MQKVNRLFLLGALFLMLAGVFNLGDLYANTAPPTQFKHFIEQVKQAALKQGVSPTTINKYLNTLNSPLPKIMNRAKVQHHLLISFNTYLKRFLKTNDINYGIKQFHKHKKLLDKISAQFKVPPQVIIALWGIESNYGRYTGNSNLIHVLASLSYQHIRSDFYRRQLLFALAMLDKPTVIPEQLKSSWDGGMGQPQFTPESYSSEFAYDFDKDGFVNIWTSLPDVFASMENYLHKQGWKQHAPCAIKITLPKNFNTALTGKKNIKTIGEWIKLGVNVPNEIKHTHAKSEQAAIVAANKNTNTAFLALNNFFVLLKWNNSANEGLATCHLADILAKEIN